jgi:hypothetical protein
MAVIPDEWIAPIAKQTDSIIASYFARSLAQVASYPETCIAVHPANLISGYPALSLPFYPCTQIARSCSGQLYANDPIYRDIWLSGF